MTSNVHFGAVSEPGYNTSDYTKIRGTLLTYFCSKTERSIYKNTKRMFFGNKTSKTEHSETKFKKEKTIIFVQ